MVLAALKRPGQSIKAKLAARRNRNTTQANPGNTQRRIHKSPVSNPRNPAPDQPTVGATDSMQLISDQKSLQTSKITQGATVILPQADITATLHNISLTITGTVSVANDVANTIDHIEVYNGDTGQLVQQIPGGTYLYDHLVRFYPVRGAYVSASSAPANAIGTSATTATAQIRIPTRIPATTTAPSKMIVWYATIATAAGSATSVAVTNDIYPRFGDCDGKWMVVRYQTVALQSGFNSLSQLGIPNNVEMTELFFRTATLTSITYVQVFSNFVSVMSKQDQAVISARDTEDYGSALQSTTMCLNLGSKWPVNATSQLQVQCSGAIAAQQLVWVWFEG